MRYLQCVSIEAEECRNVSFCRSFERSEICFYIHGSGVLYSMRLREPLGGAPMGTWTAQQTVGNSITKHTMRTHGAILVFWAWPAIAVS